MLYSESTGMHNFYLEYHYFLFSQISLCSTSGLRYAEVQKKLDLHFCILFLSSVSFSR